MTDITREKMRFFIHACRSLESQRQRDIIADAIKYGDNNEELAKKLGITTRTVISDINKASEEVNKLMGI